MVLDPRDRRIEILAEDFGLAALIECNDIEEYTVVELLVERGLLDITQYFYEDCDDEDM